MAYDALKNLAYSTVATPPSPAASGTSLVVTAGEGALFPAVSFNAVIWPPNVQPTTANSEIVRVTNIATDTFTITRTTSTETPTIGPISVAAGYQISAPITRKTLVDIQTMIPNTGLTLNAPLIGGGNNAAIGPIASVLTNGQVLGGVTGAAPAGVGGATLIFAAQGTDGTTSATTVSSVALPALTNKDVLLVITNLETATQNTAQPFLYSVTDAVNLGVVSPSPLVTTVAQYATTYISQRQGNTASMAVSSSIMHMDGSGVAGNGQFSAVTALWSSGWTLGLRHGGVTSGGTFKYQWSVYRLAGQ